MNNWISVEEKLPEIKKNVLMYYTIPHKDGFYEYWEVGCVDRIIDGGTYKHAEWQDKDYNSVTPTHWMPLTSPNPTLKEE